MATRRKKNVDRVLDWSFLDQPQEQDTTNEPYTSYRSPGRRGLGPASDYQIPEDAKPALSPEEAALQLEGEPIDSRLDALFTQFSSTRDQMSADAAFENLDALRKYEDPEVRNQARKDLEATVQRYAGQKGMEGYRLQAQKELDVLNEAERIFSTPGEYDRLLQEIGSQRILAGQEGRRSEEYYERTGNVGTRAVGDVASQLESGLSIVGAIAGSALAPGAGTAVGAAVGSAPMAKIAYDSAYTEARLAGVPREDAQNFATAMAGSEFILEAAGGATGAKLGTSVLKGRLKDKLKDFFPDLVRKRGTQALAGATGAGITGGIEEGATEGLQMFGSVLSADLVDNPEFKKFLESQAPRDGEGNINYSAAGSQAFRAGLAGFLQGATIGGGARYVSEKVDDIRNTQKAVLANTVSDQQARETFSAAIDRAAQVSEQIQQQAKDEQVPVQGELFGGESSPVSIPPATTLTTPSTPKPLPMEERAAKLREKQTQEQIKKEQVTWQMMEQDKRRLETQRRKDTDTFMSNYLANNPQATDAEVAQAGEAFKAGWKPAAKPPLKAPQKPSKPVSTPKATPVAPKAKPAPTPSQAVPEASAQDEVLRKIEGLSSEPKTQKAVVDMAKAPTNRVRNVISNLVKSRTADTDAAVELINKGKLVVVDKETDLPDGLEKGRDGWYDPQSKRVWLVAENLSPETIRGTAVHEVNHFLNLNKAKDGKSRTGIKTLLNENEGPVIKRIEALAASGNKIAMAAKARADKAAELESGDTKQFVYDNELVSYFGSEALDRISKKGVIGQAGQVLRDLKSGINTTVRKMGIQDLTDNDISYILRRQMEDAQDVEFTDGKEGLDSIIGERASGFKDQVQRTPERLYRGALDRRKRIEISDRRANIVPSRILKLQEALEQNKPASTYLGSLLEHEDLYKNYPSRNVVNMQLPTSKGTYVSRAVNLGPLKAIVVKHDPGLSEGAAYDIVNDTIVVSESVLNGDSNGLKRLLLHELQHAIQARENFANGENFWDVYQEEFVTMQNKLGVESLSEEARAVVLQRAWNKYDTTYGEAEARLSESNFNLTEEELSERLPEERMLARDISRLGVVSGVRPLDVARARPGNVPFSPALDSIKAERGGNFDNQFADKLAIALGDTNIYDTDEPEGKARVDATRRMIKNYLSKWAGTKDDPLKNIVINVGGFESTWEDLWDEALEPLSAKEVRAYLKDVEAEEWAYPNAAIPDDTLIWGALHAGYSISNGGIRGYLRHVRDYLATVPYQELSKYDLVRAVRETQQWDEEAKKKAEKANVQADKNLETYIQFPDGWRWVRLNKPGQFAAESDIMGHSVRGYEPVKKTPMAPFDWIRTEEARALLPNTPARRSSVGSLSANRARDQEIEALPEYQAYLRRFSEGEEVEAGPGGSAHYGYGGWEAIKNDRARIYSLRDPKGKSQVTVELGRDPYAYLKRPRLSGKFEVSQIKGRFNASPDPSTFPKTQDLLLNLNEEGLIDQEATFGDYYNAGLVSDSINVGLQADLDSALEAYVQEQRESARLTDPDVNFWNKKPTTRRVQRSLESSAKKKYSESSASPWDSTGMSIVRMLFDPNKGITKRGLETRDYWRLKSGGLRELAEGYTVRINNAIKKGGIDRAAFQAAVDKAESMKTPEERERAFDGIVRSYGDAGAEYRKGRMMIDSLSKEILKDWYAEVKKTGRKASAEELRVMNSIVDNVGKYSTRVYLSDVPELGQTYAKNLMKQYDKGSGKYFKVVKDAVDYLIDHEVGIPDAATLMRRSTDTVRRTYQTWIASGEGKAKEDMIAELMERKKTLGADEIDSMTRKVVREMLGLDDKESTSAVARYYRGAAVDKGILKEREKIPTELRALMGEVTDPAQKILVTISAQADLLYKNRMLNDFYDNFEGTTWVKPGDRAKAGNEKFTEKLSGEQYGPLDGMYVTKPFAYALKAVRTHTLDLKEALGMAGLDGTLPGQALAAGVARGIGKLSTAQKMSKTALDQGAWMLNAMGSPINLLKNGQLLTASKGSREALLDAVTLALQNFGVEHKKNPETNKRLSVLLEHGIPDSVFTAELRDSEKEFYEKLLNELNSGVLTNPKKVWNNLKKGLRGVRDTYGLLDSWVKIADFYGQVDYLTEYYKANGDSVSEEQINREAADIVKFRNITYSRSPIAVQTLERSGAAIFATFASEVIRTMITTPMTIKMALNKAKEAKTAEARNVALMEATKIGVGYTTALALIPSLSHMLLNQMFNGEDDDEEAKEERERFLKLWFESDRDQSYYVVGKNEAGATVLFNASRVDPNGHVTDFVRQAAQNDDPEEYWNNVKSLFTSAAGNGYADDAINLLMAKGPTASNLADMAPPIQKELQDMFEEFQWDRKQADRLTRLVDNFTPGFLKIVNQDNTRIASSKNATDQAVGNLFSAVGMRMTVIDPTKIAGFEAAQFNTARASAVKQFNELMQREGIEREDVIRTALNIYTIEQDASRRLADVYSGLNTEVAGVNPRKVLADANVAPEDIQDAALARYRSTVLSRSRLNEQEKRQLGQAESVEAKKKLRDNYRLARQVLAEMKLETR